MKSSAQRYLVGFTLVEVVVGAAILAVLLVVSAQILGATSSATAQSRQRIVADREARQALDRIAFDLSRSLLRADLAFSFSNQNGNDTLEFFSETPGEGNGGAVSAVGYRVVSGRGLERVAVAVPWENLRFDPSTRYTFNAADYRILAPGVIRLDLGYLFDGDYTNLTTPQPQGASVTHRSTLPTGADREWVADLRALVVTIAVVDEENHKRHSASWQTIVEALPDGGPPVLHQGDATAPIGLMNPLLSEWEERITAEIAGVSPTAPASVRLYSRVMPLP